MPSFDFTKYVRRNSLTEFSSLSDLNPQADWEKRNKSRESRAAQQQQENGQIRNIPSEQYHSAASYETPSCSSFGSGYENWNSDTSLLVDKEVNSLLIRTTQEMARSSAQQSPLTVQSRSGDSVGSGANLQGFGTGFGNFRDVVMSNYSDDEHNQMLNENHNRGPIDQTREYGMAGSGNERCQGFTPIDRSPMSSTRSSPRPTGNNGGPMSSLDIGSDLATPRYLPRPIIMLESDNMMRPIRRKKELETLLQATDGGLLPAVPQNVELYLDKFNQTPMEKVMHYASTGTYLDCAYHSERLCDVTIRIGEKVFSAHRVILSCYSDYFSELFLKMNGKLRVPLDVRLKGVNPEAFRVFLTYAYTGVMDIVPELVADIMKMSENLRISTLRSKCLDFMDLLPCNDILLLLANFKDFQESEIFFRAMLCVNAKFPDVTSCDIFLLLDIDTVCFILSYDHLTSCTEMDIFKAGMRWIEYKTRERKIYLERILRCVRLTLMTMDELFICVKIIQTVSDDSKCQELILRANWILTAYILARQDPYTFPDHKMRTELKVPQGANSVPYYSTHGFLPLDIEVGSVKSSTNSTPRNENTHAQQGTRRPCCTPFQSTENGGRPRAAAYEDSKRKDAIVKQEPQDKTQNNVQSVHHEMTRTGDIFAVGDFRKYSTDKQNREVKTIEQFDKDSNSWNHVTVLPEPRLHHAITMLNGNMYLVGGTDPRKAKHASYDFPTKEAFMYDPNARAWRKIASMNTPRMYHSLCVLNGMLYAIGGQGDHRRVLTTVECYNPTTDNWFYVKSMEVPRIGACAAELNGRLYVVGGYGSTVDKRSGSNVLTSVECYDPNTNRWSCKNDLRFGRCHANLVEADGKLYLCGGATRSFTMMESVMTSVGVVDVYNEVKDVWEPVTQMATPRHNAGCTVVDKKIYMIGGMCSTNNRILQSVECFDVTNNTWSNGITELPYQAQWITCVAVRRSA